MKKAIFTLILAVLIASMIAPSAMAAVTGPVTEIKKGTQVVDGVMDEIYNQSMCLLADYAWFGVDDPENAEFKGTSWYLYDDEFLYIFAKVEQTEINKADEDYFMNEAWPWMNNNIEILLQHKDNAPGTILVDAHLTRIVEITWLGSARDESADYTQRPGFEMKGGIVSDTEYAMEYKIPLNSPKQGDTMSIYFQVDRRYPDNSMSAASSYSDRPTAQQMDDFKFGAPVEMPAVAEEVAPEIAAPPADIVVQSSPSTGDVGMMAVALLFAVAATGTIIMKKSVYAK